MPPVAGPGGRRATRWPQGGLKHTSHGGYDRKAQDQGGNPCGDCLDYALSPCRDLVLRNAGAIPSGGECAVPLQTSPSGEWEAGLREPVAATASPASVVGQLRLVLGE